MITLPTTYYEYDYRFTSQTFVASRKVSEVLPNTVVCRQRAFYLVTVEGIQPITEQEAQYYTLLNLVRLYAYEAFRGERLDEQALTQAQTFLDKRQLDNARIALRKVWLSL